ncbi:MAG: hypothetical protein ABWY58_08845 [Aeromicrobium sp.]
MSTPPLRALFCIAINQNFFDLPKDGVTTGDVWTAFVALMDGIKATPGVDFIGDLDDDLTTVGPSSGWPWTCYLMADVADDEAVRNAAGLVRSIQVGDGDVKLWKFAKIEARVGRALTPREYAPAITEQENHS